MRVYGAMDFTSCIFKLETKIYALELFSYIYVYFFNFSILPAFHYSCDSNAAYSPRSVNIIDYGQLKRSTLISLKNCLFFLLFIS